MSPDMICFLLYVIGPGTSSVQLWFGNPRVEEEVWGVDAPEILTTLPTTEDRRSELLASGFSLDEVRLESQACLEERMPTSCIYTPPITTDNICITLHPLTLQASRPKSCSKQSKAGSLPLQTPRVRCSPLLLHHIRLSFPPMFTAFNGLVCER